MAFCGRKSCSETLSIACAEIVFRFLKLPVAFLAAVHRCWGYQTEANLMTYMAMSIIRLCSKEAENVPKPNNVRY